MSCLSEHASTHGDARERMHVRVRVYLQVEDEPRELALRPANLEPSGLPVGVKVSGLSTGSGCALRPKAWA